MHKGALNQRRKRGRLNTPICTSLSFPIKRDCIRYRIKTLRREVRRILSSRAQTLSLIKRSELVAYSDNRRPTIPCLQFVVARSRNRFVVHKGVVGGLKINDERPATPLAPFAMESKNALYGAFDFTEFVFLLDIPDCINSVLKTMDKHDVIAHIVSLRVALSMMDVQAECLPRGGRGRRGMRFGAVYGGDLDGEKYFFSLSVWETQTR